MHEMTLLPPRPDDDTRWRHGAGDGRVVLTCSTCAAAVPRPEPGPAITSPEDAAEVIVPRLAGRDREACLVLLLDTRHRLAQLVTASVGSIDHTFMAPRELFRDALLGNAAAIVVAHNHPSGDPSPSSDDEAVSRRLAEAGRLLGVRLLDHLVVGGDRWVSMARRGLV